MGNEITMSIGSCYRQFFGWEGRATRTEFWWWMLYNWVLLVGIGIAVSVVVSAIEAAPLSETAVEQSIRVANYIAIGVLLAHVCPGIMVLVRRIRDTNSSPLWIVTGLVPLLGPIILFIFAVTPSKEPTTASE